MARNRRRVVIERIEEDAARQVSFSKRRQGLFKKVCELSTLSGAESAILVNSPAGRVYSLGDPDVLTVVDRFLEYATSGRGAAAAAGQRGESSADGGGRRPQSQPRYGPPGGFRRRILEEELYRQLAEQEDWSEAAKAYRTTLLAAIEEKERSLPHRWAAKVEDLGLAETEDMTDVLEELALKVGDLIRDKEEEEGVPQDQRWSPDAPAPPVSNPWRHAAYMASLGHATPWTVASALARPPAASTLSFPAAGGASASASSFNPFLLRAAMTAPAAPSPLGGRGMPPLPINYAAPGLRFPSAAAAAHLGGGPVVPTGGSGWMNNPGSMGGGANTFAPLTFGSSSSFSSAAPPPVNTLTQLPWRDVGGVEGTSATPLLGTLLENWPDGEGTSITPMNALLQNWGGDGAISPDRTNTLLDTSWRGAAGDDTTSMQAHINSFLRQTWTAGEGSSTVPVNSLMPTWQPAGEGTSAAAPMNPLIQNWRDDVEVTSINASINELMQPWATDSITMNTMLQQQPQQQQQQQLPWREDDQGVISATPINTLMQSWADEGTSATPLSTLMQGWEGDHTSTTTPINASVQDGDDNADDPGPPSMFF